MLLKLTLRAFEFADHPLYIITPRRRLLTLYFIIFALFTTLLSVTFTFTIAFYLTPPFLIYLGFVFFLLSKVWLACRYSIFYIIIAPLMSLIISFFVKYAVYQLTA